MDLGLVDRLLEALASHREAVLLLLLVLVALVDGQAVNLGQLGHDLEGRITGVVEQSPL